MPYIKTFEREKLDRKIFELVKSLQDLGLENRAGNLNYTICMLLIALYPKNKYRELNDMMGVLDCVSREMYRRRVAPYEDEAMSINGDLNWHSDD